MANGVGALTPQDLLAAWQSGADEGYTQPLIAAGDGQGLEVFSQAAVQLARVSQCSDNTFGSFYILPWSGQTAPSAGGAQQATVTITVTRNLRLDVPLVLPAGAFVEEVAFDWGPTGAVPVQTGRRFQLLSNVVFFSGDSGPYNVIAQAEKPGWGYNNPQPGSISLVDQPGSGYENTLASVTFDPGSGPPTPRSLSALLISAPQPDMFVLEHVGQYVAFTAGANVGQVARISAVQPPVPPTSGTTAVLDSILCFECTTFSGPFFAGELATFKSGGVTVGSGTVLASAVNPASGNLRTVVHLSFDSGFAAGVTCTGVSSALSATLTRFLYRPSFTAEAPSGGAGGASWKVLDWAADLGVEVTNAAQPSGGRLGVLDELGRERGVPRAGGEGDIPYAKRVHAAPDKGSTNALKRALNKLLGPGSQWCLREVGTALLPGMFYDGGLETPSSTPGRGENDCYDVDTVSWSGGVYVGTFKFQEPCVYVDASGNQRIFGYVGSTVGGLTMIRRQTTQGAFPATSSPTDRVKGLISGATYQPLANPVQSPSFTARRFRMVMNYAEFRAFFLVGLPPSNAGEFGFAYDSGTSNAYDLTGTVYPTFYDGYPVDFAEECMAVWNTMNATKDGGVGFDLYLEPGPCS